MSPVRCVRNVRVDRMQVLVAQHITVACITAALTDLSSGCNTFTQQMSMK